MKSLSDRLRPGTASGVLAALLLGLASPQLAAADGERFAGVYSEGFRAVPMPAEFHVEATELDGPVFANADGLTLYEWPQNRGRNGYSGEGPGAIECRDEAVTVTAGLMSPYPPGIRVPDADRRPTCTDQWRPVLATEDAEPVGDWTLLERDDGALQWAFDEQALYTSIRDSRPGDVLGGSTRRSGGDSPAIRVPVGPPSQLPPGFAVRSTTIGRMLGTDRSDAVYAYEGDTATSTACVDACLADRQPVLAPALARPQGEWSVLERSPGVHQWVYRGQPLYTHRLDQESWSQQGSDAPGWSNVFTQVAPPPPASFTRQDTIAGTVLADSRGMTIYTYTCGEDTVDQLACDHPDDTQVYRLAMCGAGDPQRCLEHWPYVEAAPDAVSANRIWRILVIDPLTGRLATPGQEGTLRVWAYRDRPVYTFGDDRRPGDVHGAGTGEWRGQRNGLKAFWLRDDFMNGIL
ncbi:MAG TPA: hypothetical protein VLA56_19400 [Pseudomonadales bacterium]|nr:hypothetical protein [Pseudomonadales bacterium]